MALHGKEKIWYVFNRLVDARDETIGNIVGLHPMDDLNDHFSHPDFINIIDKLETEKVAKFISLPSDQTYLKYQVKILPGFDDYHKKLWEDPQYRKFSRDKYPPKGLPKNRLYFNGASEVDLTLSKEENKNRYLTIGKVAEIYRLSVEDQASIYENNLTPEQVKEVQDIEMISSRSLKELSSSITSSLSQPKIKITNPPNYDAEIAGLFRQMVERKDGKSQIPHDSSIAFSIFYSNSRDLILNGSIVLSCPTFNGENDLVFSKLFNNPGKTFTKKQLEEEISIKITKDFHKIIENLGFKGDLAKIFFSVSKTSIMFKNPISNDDLAKMGLTLVRLNKTNNS